MSLKVFSILILCVFFPSCWTKKADVLYNATWESLDSRPLPAWYDQSKFGIFIHWGVYSVPSFGSEWFWWSWQGDHSESHVEFMNQNYPPGFTYGDFGPQFTAEFYEPNDWADLLAASGAKYVVLTSKHHEGYTLWPSAYSFNWNAVDIGAHRDLVGELAEAVRNRTDLHFGLYHSLFEWFNPLYLQDKANEFKTESFVNAKVIPELVEVVNKYQPDVVWSDGDWEARDIYWKSTDFLAWLYNESPVKDTVVTNDRWGSGVACNHGGYYTCTDHFNPGVLQPHKWENCMTIDKDSWGYVRKSKLESYRTTHELLNELISTVSCGGNLLLNVGPTHDGRILPIFEDRLRQIGEWLGVNGEAVYASVPWAYQNDTVTPNIWYTSKGGVVYATILSWPLGDKVYLGAVQGTANTAISLLGQTDSVFTWQNEAAGGTTVYFPRFNPVTLVSKWAWVLKLENITPTPGKFNYPKTMSKITENSNF